MDCRGNKELTGYISQKILQICYCFDILYIQVKSFYGQRLLSVNDEYSMTISSLIFHKIITITLHSVLHTDLTRD